MVPVLALSGLGGRALRCAPPGFGGEPADHADHAEKPVFQYFSVSAFSVLAFQRFHPGPSHLRTFTLLDLRTWPLLQLSGFSLCPRLQPPV